MKSRVLFFVLFLSISISAMDFFLKPGVKRINTGLGAFWVYQGGEIGVTYKEHHQFSLDAYFFNDVENTVYYYDTISGSNSWSDEIRHYGNLYLTYAYLWRVKEFLRLSAGVSIGVKYAEYDRNFDTTVTLLHSVDNLNSTIHADIHLRHEAEGRFLSFGGPRGEIEVGHKRVFLRYMIQLNVGRFENWGYYSIRDKEVTHVFFDTLYKIGDIEVEKAGWSGISGNSLFTKLKIIPELLFGITILL